MSKGFELASPLIVLNMGGEMIYILDQRLKAQSVEPSKAIKVLSDVTKTLFSDDFVIKLFEPQKIFSLSFTRHIFEKVVHCSIMKLNETSMSKLFDLMTMGFKHQIIASKTPHDLFHITLNHLNGIKAILREGDSLKYIHKVKELFVEKFSKLTLMDYIFLRQDIFKFLQDKIIRVSVFLQENIQNSDGSIIISNKGVAGVHVQTPGLIITYNSSGRNQSNLDIKSARDFIVNTCKSYSDNKTIELGNNLYASDKGSCPNKPDIEHSKFSELNTSNQRNLSLFKNMNLDESKESSDDALKQKLNINSVAAKNELNLLASLIKGTEQNKNEQTLKLNLFPNTRLKNPSHDNFQQSNDYDNDIIIIDSIQESKKLKSEMDKLFDDIGPKNCENNEQPKDLLELMLENEDEEEFKT